MESSEKKFRWCFQEHLHMNGMWLQADRKVAQQRTSRHERCPWLWAQVSHTDCFQIRGKYTRHVKTRSELGLQAVNWRLLKVYRAIQSTNMIIFFKKLLLQKNKTKKEKTSVWTENATPEKPVEPEKLTAFFYCCVCVCVFVHRPATAKDGKGGHWCFCDDITSAHTLVKSEARAWFLREKNSFKSLD